MFKCSSSYFAKCNSANFFRPFQVFAHVNRICTRRRASFLLARGVVLSHPLPVYANTTRICTIWQNFVREISKSSTMFVPDNGTRPKIWHSYLNRIFARKVEVCMRVRAQRTDDKSLSRLKHSECKTRFWSNFINYVIPAVLTRVFQVETVKRFG